MPTLDAGTVEYKTCLSLLLAGSQIRSLPRPNHAVKPGFGTSLPAHVVYCHLVSRRDTRRTSHKELKGVASCLLLRFYENVQER